jgi:hypothetical protein
MGRGMKLCWHRPMGYSGALGAKRKADRRTGALVHMQQSRAVRKGVDESSFLIKS